MPIYLGIALCSLPPAGDQWNVNDLDRRGLHAVATLGFSMGVGETRPIGAAQFRLAATQMDKIYVHDDQVGPFARMELADIATAEGNVFSLGTSWGEAPGGPTAIALPELMIVPLYHKIRVPFDTVLQAVYDFDAGLKAFLASIPDFDFSLIHWDIHLSTTTAIKAEVMALEGMAPDRRRTILTQPLPRFLWRIEMFFRNEGHGIILMDATDIEQGGLVVDIIEKNWLCEAWRLAADVPEVLNHQLKPQWKIWQWLIEHPRDEVLTPAS